MAQVIMIQGTMSNVGKSVITAGLCRIFAQDGYKVAPFKSQNMALNSYITKEGLEMGRAQVVQAEAAGIPPDVRMNPILLKPTSDQGSQVIVLGEVVGNMTAQAYFKEKHTFKTDIISAFQSLSQEFDIIVIEGAGSPAEINLNRDDFVNMGLAAMVDAPVLLVGDIDRGGIFATLYGTVSLLKPEEQARVKGVIINKFRGDLSLFTAGVTQLEELLSKPVVGVLPYIPLDIEGEDSLSTKHTQKEQHNLLDIAIISLPKLSNFTDFTPLDVHPSVSIRYVSSVTQLQQPDCVILPGSKNTMGDLLWLRETGLEGAISKLVEENVPLLGICGGFQMMGSLLSDPLCVEEGGELTGMCYFQTETTFKSEKVRTQIKGTTSALSGIFAPLSSCSFSGYEIHMGSTTSSESPFSQLENTLYDGCSKNNLLGTYVHGIFEDPVFCQTFLHCLQLQKGVSPDVTTFSTYSDHKEQQYNSLAQALRTHLDMEKIYSILNKTESNTSQ